MSEAFASASPQANVSQAVEHLFRHESGKMVATLTRIFGLERLTLAEMTVDDGGAPAEPTTGCVNGSAGASPYRAQIVLTLCLNGLPNSQHGLQKSRHLGKRNHIRPVAEGVIGVGMGFDE